MGKPAGNEISGLEKSLISESQKYSFVQAYRLLLYLLARKTNLPPSELHSSIRVRPDLTLAFPTSDVASIEYRDDKYIITATFLGLYGASSPLPSFYTEEIIEDQLDDVTIVRDFFDLVNDRLYKLFFKIWSRFNLHYKAFEERDKNSIDQFFTFTGFAEERLRKQIEQPENLVRLSAVFSLIPRSCEGIRTLVSTLTGIKKVSIILFETKYLAIPESQRAFIGKSNNMVGENLHLGELIEDSVSEFTIVLGPVDFNTYENWMPERINFLILNKLISLYVDRPISWSFEFLIKADGISCCCPGEDKFSRLGLDTWIFSDKKDFNVYKIKAGGIK